MATIGFESAHFGIYGEDGEVTEYAVDKSAGGTIEASISGLGSEPLTVYASNVPFYVSARGVGETSISMNVFDLQGVTGLYNQLLGVETVDGINVVGQDTEAPYAGVVLVAHNKDGKEMYIGLTKVRFGHPEVALNTKEAGSAEPNTDTLEGACITDSRGYVYATAVEASTTMTLDKFKAFVFNKPSGA